MLHFEDTDVNERLDCIITNKKGPGIILSQPLLICGLSLELEQLRLLSFPFTRRAIWCIFRIWEVPSIESLMPVAEQLKVLGWNTDIIPVDKPEVALQKIGMAMQASMKK